MQTNTKESWEIENTECTIEEEPLLLERENTFFNLLETITSPKGMEVINENELMQMVVKSIKYFIDAGCLKNKKTLQESIETVQELMYASIGDQPCGKHRDELIVFIHQKIPSIFQGAYWGYSLSRLPSSEEEEDNTSEPKKEIVVTVSSAPYYGCCSRFCFRRTVNTRTM
jgi:hypothetical protein